MTIGSEVGDNIHPPVFGETHLKQTHNYQHTRSQRLKMVENATLGHKAEASNPQHKVFFLFYVVVWLSH